MKSAVGEELFHLSPLPAWRGGLLSQNQVADGVQEDHRSRNPPKGTTGSHVWLRKSLICKYLGAEEVQPGLERDRQGGMIFRFSSNP